MKSINITVFVLLFSLISNTSVSADNSTNQCIFSASRDSSVSLGLPVAMERLAHKSQIKIGVLLLTNAESPKKQLTRLEKDDYLEAATSISKLSNKKVNIEIKFLGSLITSESLEQAFYDRNQAFQDLDDSKGTYSFVRNVLLAADSQLDFSNLDSVILEADNPNVDIAEAMQLFRGSDGNVFRNSSHKFFQSVKTQDGVIDNAILLNNHKPSAIIAHEIMHNFGLTDLYGGMNSPSWMSMMASGSNALLNYEKAVLGWFPPDRFICKEMSDFLKQDSIETVVKLNDLKQDSIFLLKISEDSGYFVEILNRDGKTWLVTYLFEQNQRPPMKVFYDWSLTYAKILDLQDPKSIGLSYKTPDFQLLVTDINRNSAVLNFIPPRLVGSSEVLALIQKSESNRVLALASVAEVTKSVTPNRKSSIICIKGTKTKKVTSLKPKCPTGFRIR